MARATMAGDDVTAIVTDIYVGERISTFTLDYRKKKIYFIDYDTVRCPKILGSKLTINMFFLLFIDVDTLFSCNLSDWL